MCKDLLLSDNRAKMTSVKVLDSWFSLKIVNLCDKVASGKCMQAALSDKGLAAGGRRT